MKKSGNRVAIGRGLFLSLCCCFCLLLMSGCATMYPYLATDNDCRCEEYRINDGSITYLFQSRYRMSGGITTTIDIEFINNSDDTLSLDLGSVKVSSRNIAYQFNDKFIPLPALKILPKRSDVVHLTGQEITGEDDWLKIAGERMTVTLQGVRLGGRELKPQQMEFAPTNPKLQH